MSGIAGLINADGKPINERLLRQMTDFMAYRGPDAQETWSDGCAGFGHALLSATQEPSQQRQPFSLDHRIWITSDARIDGRAELAGLLGAKVAADLSRASDAELILRAYIVWGDQCVDHLIGDFAFAIWDARKRRLFCARDHFGVKPFYYAQTNDSLIFSNTLNCVRLHPGISDELNDQAIGDFLLFALNQELDTTVFAEIKRLPPAHCLIWADGQAKAARYWKLRANKIVYYKRASDYVERFEELMRAAVEDRLRAKSVGVSMSGGLDSTAVAAFAQSSLSKQYSDFDLYACSVVYDKLIPDEERRYSQQAADHLAMPIKHLAADNYQPFERWSEAACRQPEPYHDPLLVISADLLKLIAARSRVVLTGWDGDAVLSEQPAAYFARLLKEKKLGRLATCMGWYVLSQRQLPPVGLRTWLKRRLGKYPVASLYPSWLNQSFAKRMNLHERWKQINMEPPPEETVRPYASRVFSLPNWSTLFESYDAGITGELLEARHPLVDVRLVDYLLSIPPVPWCVKKQLLRTSMRGILPDAIALRPKSPLAADPLVESLRGRDTDFLDRFDAAPELEKYVERRAIPSIAGEENSDRLWMNIRPFSLNCWLQNKRSVKCRPEPEKNNGH
jgi:asparagine synthase (glutamine-hydrolysing)